MDEDVEEGLRHGDSDGGGSGSSGATYTSRGQRLGNIGPAIPAFLQNAVISNILYQPRAVLSADMRRLAKFVDTAISRAAAGYEVEALRRSVADLRALVEDKLASTAAGAQQGQA